MNNYNPTKNIDPEQWLEMEESNRIDLVKAYHRKLDLDMEEDSFDAHCIIHTVVENQVAMQVEYVPETLFKLLRQGLGRHETIHAIGAIICEDIFNILNEKEPHSPKKYRRHLEKLTAKRWKKGQY